MVCVTKGDPTVVIGAAAVRDRTVEGQVHFHAKVAFMVRACRFIVAPDLAVAAEGDFLMSPCIIRRG